MDWILIFKIIGAIACVVGIYYLVIYGCFFWGIAESICKFFEICIGFITYPFKGIKDFVTKKKEQYTYSGDAISRFADRHPNLGTERSIKFFIVAVIFLIVVFTVKILQGNFEDFLENLFRAYPLIYVVDTFGGSHPLTIVGVISTGISALFMSAFFSYCVGNFERKGYFLRWIVSIPYYIVTTLLGCYFGMVLSNLWEWAANAGIDLFNILANAFKADSKTLLGILIIVGSFIALVVLLYVGLILLLTALKEYLEIFIYGLIGLLILAVCAILMLIWGGQEFINSSVGNGILTTVLIIALFVVDFMRVNKGELLGTDKL